VRRWCVGERYARSKEEERDGEGKEAVKENSQSKVIGAEGYNVSLCPYTV